MSAQLNGDRLTDGLIPRRKFRDIAEANQYKAIRARCMPKFEQAEGKSWQRKAALYSAMVEDIADVLEVEVPDEELVVPAVPTDRLLPNVTITQIHNGFEWRYIDAGRGAA